jgi:hypothetical protein
MQMVWSCLRWGDLAEIGDEVIREDRGLKLKRPKTGQRKAKTEVTKGKTGEENITLLNALCRRDCPVPIERIVYNKADLPETGP